MIECKECNKVCLRLESCTQPPLTWLYGVGIFFSSPYNQVGKGLVVRTQTSPYDETAVYSTNDESQYLKQIDRKCGQTTLTLNWTGSFKALCSYLVLDMFICKIGNSPHQIMTQLFLLRPTWITAAVAGAMLNFLHY